jgi:hypothetical protein
MQQKKQAIQLENGQNTWMNMAKMHKKTSTPLPIRDMQIKPQWGIITHPSEWLK